MSDSYWELAMEIFKQTLHITDTIHWTRESIWTSPTPNLSSVYILYSSKEIYTSSFCSVSIWLASLHVYTRIWSTNVSVFCVNIFLTLVHKLRAQILPSTPLWRGKDAKSPLWKLLFLLTPCADCVNVEIQMIPTIRSQRNRSMNGFVSSIQTDDMLTVLFCSRRGREGYQ